MNKWLVKCLLACVVVEIIGAEALLAFVTTHAPISPHAAAGFTNVYMLCGLAAIPAVAGIRGYWVAKGLTPLSVDDLTPLRLSGFFLSGVAFTYGVIISIVMRLS